MRVRAAVLHKAGLPPPYKVSKPLEIAEVDLAPPGRGEALVKIKAAGLCHSDLSVIDGSRPRPLPMALGHEAAGIVEALGEGVVDLKVGDHVVLVFVPSCGRCGPCAAGRPALCEPAVKANVAGTLLSGERRLALRAEPVNHLLGVSAFADYAVVARESCVKIDSALPFELAALFGCAVLTGVGAVVNTAKVEPGQSVAVVGLGGVGLSAVLGAKLAGARQIVAVDTSAERLAFAAKLGATDAVERRRGRRRRDGPPSLRGRRRRRLRHGRRGPGARACLRSDRARRNDSDRGSAPSRQAFRACPPPRWSSKSGR